MDLKWAWTERQNDRTTERLNNLQFNYNRRISKVVLRSTITNVVTFSLLALTPRKSQLAFASSTIAAIQVNVPHQLAIQIPILSLIQLFLGTELS
jgi:hypothetical protein